MKGTCFILLAIFSLFVLSGCDSISGLVTKECPQINVPIIESGVPGLMPYMNVKSYDGWQIASYSNYAVIYCHRGDREGQNPNYLYCGDSSEISQTEMAYMQKTLMNNDGTIGKTIKQSFVNIYELQINEVVKHLCEVQKTKSITGINPDTGTRETFECDNKEYNKFVFLKTVCGEDPDKISEREFKEQMNEMENWFG